MLNEDLVDGPIEVGQLLDELGLVVVGGLAVLHVLPDVSLVGFHLLGRDDEGLAGKAVFAG